MYPGAKNSAAASRTNVRTSSATCGAALPSSLSGKALLLVEADVPRPGSLGGNALRGHEAVKRCHCWGTGFEISRPVTLGDEQRRPAVLVGFSPDLGVGLLFGEQLNDRREASVGGAMHGGLAIVVHCIDVRAQFEKQLGSFERFFLCSGFLKVGFKYRHKELEVLEGIR